MSSMHFGMAVLAINILLVGTVTAQTHEVDLAWASVYDTPTENDHEIHGLVALPGSKSVTLVTAGSPRTSVSLECRDTNGRELWIRELPGREAFDEAFLNAYSTGETLLALRAGEDSVLILLSADGQILWNLIPDSVVIGTSFRIGNVSLANDGDIVVSGLQRMGPADMNQMAGVIKYAPDGTLRWRRDFPGASYAGAVPSVLGETYFVAGEIAAPHILHVYRLDSAGQTIWSRIAPGSIAGRLSFLGADDQGNLYVMGGAPGNSTQKVFKVSISSSLTHWGSFSLFGSYLAGAVNPAGGVAIASREIGAFTWITVFNDDGSVNLRVQPSQFTYDLKFDTAGNLYATGNHLLGGGKWLYF